MVSGFGFHVLETGDPVLDRRVCTKQIGDAVIAQRINKEEMGSGGVLTPERTAATVNFLEGAD